MRAKQQSPIPAERIALYEALLAAHPDIERKGADNPYTSLNGNMFSLLLSPEGRLALRLPQPDRDSFLEKYDTALFEAYGTVMKEYVAVPDALLENTAELQPYFDLSYEYARTLRPKATTRSKPAAQAKSAARSKPPSKPKAAPPTKPAAPPRTAAKPKPATSAKAAAPAKSTLKPNSATGAKLAAKPQPTPGRKR